MKRFLPTGWAALIILIALVSLIIMLIAKKTSEEITAPITTKTTAVQKDWPICADEKNINFSHGVEKITILSREECWTGYVTVPADWPQYHVSSLPNNGFEIKYLDGTRVWFAPDAIEWREDLRVKKSIFRLRGKGPIIVSRNL